jgi:cyclopropane-fatty-acyl-phospholipid synthase
VDSVCNIGPHYARTLREWRKRFLDRFESVIVPALQMEYPKVMSGQNGKEEMEVFKRKWICMYCLGSSSRNYTKALLINQIISELPGCL